MKTLKGRKIGLNAKMTKEQMKKHIITKITEWTTEGFTETEIKDAIVVKCRPLINGFYWQHYKQSQITLKNVLKELEIFA